MDQNQMRRGYNTDNNDNRVIETRKSNKTNSNSSDIIDLNYYYNNLDE